MTLPAASHARDLTDEQWVLIGPFLPKLARRTDGRRRPWRENRAVLNGILSILRTGAPWADLPDRYSSYQTCHRRFQQWVRAGVLRGVLEVLAQALHDEGYLDLQETFIDGSFAPAKQGGAGVGKTKRGKGSKIMAIADRRGLPVAVHIESATPHEVTLVHATLAQRFVKPFPVRLIGHNAYESARTTNVAKTTIHTAGASASIQIDVIVRRQFYPACGPSVIAESTPIHGGFKPIDASNYLRENPVGPGMHRAPVKRARSFAEVEIRPGHLKSSAQRGESSIMKPFGRTWTLGVVVALAVSAQLPSAQARKPSVMILATGGTIAGAAASGTQAGYTSGAVSIDTMISGVPGITNLATIKGEQISNVGSQDMSFEIMLKVAKRINELARSNDVDGIVITHGTDTMEETAFFLNLTVKTDKPVVMVGSMRPSTAVSADGPLNLYNAVGVAADPKAKGRGVLVVMNDWIHAAHSLTKTSTTAVQTFMSPLRGLVGVASYGHNDFYTTPEWKHTTQTEFDISQVSGVPRVDIIFASADMSPDLIDAAAANGAKGIVIAGVGNGNMNKASVTAAANAVKKGVVVVRSSRVAVGSVGRNVELNDDELGFIASDELNPQKSRILLTLALLKNRSPKELQTLFTTY